MPANIDWRTLDLCDARRGVVSAGERHGGVVINVARGVVQRHLREIVGGAEGRRLKANHRRHRAGHGDDEEEQKSDGSGGGVHTHDRVWCKNAGGMPYWAPHRSKMLTRGQSVRVARALTQMKLRTRCKMTFIPSVHKVHVVALLALRGKAKLERAMYAELLVDAL